MTRTTPPRPLDITEAFPELAGLARTACRLHPVPGKPTVHDSSVGGPLLWPADEPWPEYELTYVPYEPVTKLADIHLRRTLLTRTYSPPGGPGETLTEDEQETLRRASADHPPESFPSGPQALIPLAQLYSRDAPGLAFPQGTDLLQVLWAPSYEIEGDSAAVQLRWRRTSEVRDVLLAAPEPVYVAMQWCVPVPCVLHPEPVREFPPYQSLDKDLAARLMEWDFYESELSVAPGWKAGGWPAHFTFRDPPEPDSAELRCPECGGPVDALLTVGGTEWGKPNDSWRPVECGEGAERAPGQSSQDLRDPTDVTIGRGYTLQIYNCVGTPSHLPRRIMQ
ncbi:hypothetical protein [Peterkaempfera sp. SMS 1(5)a]|uniref:hypothetical protein n=1 Tax=Peterkaempfera podocarpi TaxID=3232308 RepID=UPI003672197C